MPSKKALNVDTIYSYGPCERHLYGLDGELSIASLEASETCRT
jgi:hypothetical protein